MLTHQGFSSTPTRRPVVALSLPADPVFLSVLRSSAVALAARADLSLDELEDLRIAVSEAAAIVLATASGEAFLDAEIELQPDGVRLSLRCADAWERDGLRESFAWTVLGTLASGFSFSSDSSGVVLELVKRREVSS